jgi:hypothetical protein
MCGAVLFVFLQNPSHRLGCVSASAKVPQKFYMRHTKKQIWPIDVESAGGIYLKNIEEFAYVFFLYDQLLNDSENLDVVLSTKLPRRQLTNQ